MQTLSVTFQSEPAIYTDANRTYYLPVSISWQPPQYPNGEITTYRYSLVETNAPSTVIISDTNTSGTVLSVEESVTVSPFTNYTATIVAFTSVGRGELVTQVALSPEASKFDCTCILFWRPREFNLLISSPSPLAPGPVQNLTVTLSESATYNSTTRTYDIPVSISWQPPEYPNGEIVMYNYRLVETNADGRVVIDGNTTNTELSVEQNVTVSPFTNYTVTVVAFTSAGSGESVMEVVLSPEASKFDCTCILCLRPREFNLLISSPSPLAPGPVQNLTVTLSESATYNSTTRTYDIPVSISWQPPEYPNGEIVMYNYRLVETNGRVVIDRNTTNTELSVEENVTVLPFTNYTATVVAFTSAGGGEPVMDVALSPEAGKFIFVCMYVHMCMSS